MWFAIQRLSTVASPAEHVFKIVFVGDSGVGKTCVIYRFCQNSFRTSFTTTIGMYCHARSQNYWGRPMFFFLYIFSGKKHDHVTPLLRDLHWLRVQQRIEYKIAVLVYQCLHGLAPAYMSSQLQSVKDLPSRQRLRSSSSHFLLVPTSRLSTVGDRAFPVAAARVWNRPTLSRCHLSQLSNVD